MNETLTQADMVDLIRRGKRAKSLGDAVNRIVTSLVTSAVACLLDGFWLMLAVGIIHADWIPALPTVGYWTAVVVVALLRGTFSPIRSKDGTQR